MTAAILIVGTETSNAAVAASNFRNDREVILAQAPLACIEVLGCSVLSRTLDELRRAGFDSISVVGDRTSSPRCLSEQPLVLLSAQDVWRSVEEKIEDLKELGATAVLIQQLGAYVEFDAAQMLQAHSEENAAVTRAFERQGALDLWILNPARIASTQGLREFLQNETSSYYSVPGYVNRLEGARDLRRLVADGLSSRCRFRPAGFEVRPGVWMAPGAEIERSARIVAPAFIGRSAKIAGQCLITRCTNVERNSHIDYGTAVEDSSVLANTYVGIGLDLSHAVVDGSYLLNLRHDVTLEIADPVVLRQARVGRERGVNAEALANVSEMDISSADPER